MANYSKRTGQHGTQEVEYQGLAEGDELTYATGVNALAPSVDQDTTTFYADAQEHLVLQNPKVLTLEQTNYQLSPEEYAQCGYTGSETQGWTDNGIYKPFNMQYILEQLDEDGNRTKVLNVFYNCVSGTYTPSDDEDEDAIALKSFTRTVTVKGLKIADKNGKESLVKHFSVTRSEANAKVFDTYTTAILKPEDFFSATTPAEPGVSVTVDTDTVSVAVGKSVTVDFTVKPADAKVTVESNDDAIATASLSGNTITITGVAAGDTAVYISNDVINVTVTAA